MTDSATVRLSELPADLDVLPHAPMPKPKHPGGRPSTYSEVKANEILQLLSDGELLLVVCEREDMPSMQTVSRWKEAHPWFREAYARARIEQAHSVAMRGVRAAREATPETASVARVKFDAERWLAGKLLGSVYGDKAHLDVTGRITLAALIEGSLDALPAPDSPTIEGTPLRDEDTT